MNTTKSGLQYYDFRRSDGAIISEGQQATVHYRVALSADQIDDGPWIDDSWQRNEPISFRLGAGEVIKGIDEGLPGMRIAGERVLIIPPHLAFDTKGVPGRVPPGAILTFCIYLVTIAD